MQRLEREVGVRLFDRTSRRVTLTAGGERFFHIRHLGGTVVPGHGPVFTDDAPVQATLDYLRFVADLAVRGKEAGVSSMSTPRWATWSPTTVGHR